MKLHYEIILYWSLEDSAYIAEVPELPGCAADGDTDREALQNVEIIMQEWIETAKELGRKIPKPQGRLISAELFESGYSSCRDVVYNVSTDTTLL
ncbi:type II toxin-antitoxin system HicB family antitoxin [Oscillatoria sp. FACHB-1406]|uniref:type II toxin-antitoxin system HicB family antitoxin n=1 Tax=Oscillatoria sp. FACHB-1406 TaxID=2692846 RepID=UPI0016839B95|nr:type II toxin-antitoxin system HicB family antitoxin [Oscillatoria sp. FACHB-1406]MBD2578775.1 type II toxin-antitoxin system HicB family antitoxin [Oscillatoria sp. FACHB-1406]